MTDPATLLLIEAWLNRLPDNTCASYADAIGYPYSPITGKPRDTATLRGGVTWLRWCDQRGLDPLAVSRGDTQAWIDAINHADLAPTTRGHMVKVADAFHTWACREGHADINPMALIDRTTVR